MIELRRYSDGSRRWMLAGTRLDPHLFWCLWDQGHAIEWIVGPDMYPWATVEQVWACINWVEARRTAARRGWATRKASRSHTD